MKNVVSVKVSFENCEYAVIPASCIGMFLLDSVSIVVQRVAVNAINPMNVAKVVAFELFSEANSQSEFNSFEKNFDLFKRISQWDDIVDLELVYDDGSSETFYVDYCSEGNDSGEDNDYQTSYVSEQGNMYVVVGKDKVIADFFTDEYMNDEENVRFRKEMLSPVSLDE